LIDTFKQAFISKDITTPPSVSFFTYTHLHQPAQACNGHTTQEANSQRIMHN